ncbi:ABC transporter substrate-binding protein [Aminobacter sp. AP02]|uniref:ABC transporter substrate-binding protein n=1 Tax=Aminobacter sp. AP02 TaxID=2135737 RepID=UPI0011B29088|nr:ABC transporter substrate-binding protein [Aminobacter sp. AP02]
MTRDLTTNSETGTIGCILYQGLMGINAEGEAYPLLAKSVDISDDKLTYKFVLNDARWQDGKPITAKDVKYTYEEISGKHSPTFKRTLTSIDKIEAVSDKEIVITLKKPYGPILIALTCQQGAAILPEHVYVGTDPLTNKASNAEPVSSGPFILKEWVRGSHLRLVKNPDYWEQGKPYLDEIIAQVVPSGAGRTQALLSGQVDRIPWFALETSDYPLIERNPQLLLQPARKPPATDFISINTEKKPFDDKRVRQALMFATDREFLLKSAFNGQGAASTSPFAGGFPWAIDPEMDLSKMYPYDPARANALLDEAGVTRDASGKRLSMNFIIEPGEEGGSQIAAALKNMWEQVGIDLTIETIQPPLSTERIAKGEANIAYHGYSSGGDPAIGWSGQFVSTTIGSLRGNAARYSNPEIDELFTLGQSETDLDARGVYYKKAQKILGEDMPILTIHDPVDKEAQGAWLKGMENEYMFPTWRDAWVDK